MTTEQLQPFQDSIARALLSARIRYNNERELQDLMEVRLATVSPDIAREYILSKRNRPDFFWTEHGIVIEAKIDRGTSTTFRQLVRYAQHERVKAVILCRHRRIDVPDQIGEILVRQIPLYSMML